MAYRKLRTEEVKNLIRQGCTCDQWSTVEVQEDFSCERIWNVHFSGKIRLGRFTGEVQTDDGIVKPCGIYQAFLKDCTIEDDVYISEVKNLVNYRIQHGVVLENISRLTVSGLTSFGNGTEIEILNEAGGRELLLYDQLSAQIAYLMVLFRHDPVLIQRLSELIQRHVEGRKSRIGIIGSGTRILNCQTLKNITVGENTVISGALHLENGTIISNEVAPVVIGPGVVAKSFIIQSGSQVDGSAMLDRCFIGQGVRIGKQFSAENSAFFANSEGFHGEACSIFAGPYTVTHHKSTLLIAGLFSFYNAGSGSNQSNHMYKVGPVHQGILERGCKTGSFSYMIWPSRVGAFTGVIGKHYVNLNTSSFPFSYLLESNGKSLLMPAMNLFTVGTKRDSAKWPERDRRKDSEKLDLIHFQLFNPYTVGRILQAIQCLTDLEAQPHQHELLEYQGVYVKRSKLNSARASYQLAVNIFIGEEFLRRLEKAKTSEDFRQVFLPQLKEGTGPWIDLAGLLAPGESVETLIHRIKSGDLASIEQVVNEFKVLYNSYSDYAWNWCGELLQTRSGKKIGQWDLDDFTQLIEEWKNSSLTANEMILKDARKEFTANSQIGYGIDGGQAIQQADFEAVRGKFESNKFVLQIKNESEAIQKKAEEAKALLHRLWKRPR